MQVKRGKSIEKCTKTVVSLLFVLFTVFTSCTARQLLHASTDHELSKTFNANKASKAAVENCRSFLSEVKVSNEINTAQISPAIAFLLLSSLGFFAFSTKGRAIFNPFLPVPLRDRPLYILYSKRKILD